MSEYPLENDVYDGIRRVRAKPFDTAFDTQTEAAEALYELRNGRHVFISKLLSWTLSHSFVSGVLTGLPSIFFPEYNSANKFPTDPWMEIPRFQNVPRVLKSKLQMNTVRGLRTLVITTIFPANLALPPISWVME